MSRRPIFLDRDGVINVDIEPYVCRLEQLELFPWTVQALTTLDRAGYDIYVVSNQQGVAFGLIDPAELDRITASIQEAVCSHGFQIRKFYYSVGRWDENDPTRKPSPGMVLAAGKEFGFDPARAFLIGDKDTDIECACRAGCRPILVHSGVTSPGESSVWQYHPEREFANLLDAANWICSTDLER